MLRPVPQKQRELKKIRITVTFRDVTHPTINQSVQSSAALCCGFNHISPCQHE